jgi:hypothetical protein
MHDLTIDLFKKALPDKVKKSVNQELIDQVNKMLSDPDMYEHYRENMLSYTSVMADGKFKISNYVDAVKYVSHKLMGCTNLLAYTKTFPDKYNGFVARGVTSSDIASYVTAYNKSKLVNLIFAQTLVPSYVLNADMYQKALNVQADLMVNANSEKVRSDAANSILTHLKVPETQKIELDIGVRQDSSIDALRASTMELVAQQRLMIQANAMTAGQVAGSKLLIENGEVIDA